MRTARPRGRHLVVPVLVVLIALAGCGTGPGTVAPVATPDGAQRVEVGFAGGGVAGGVARWAVPVGSTVELVVRSDVADEVHVHGYERRGYVTAGASATLRFAADLPGTFEVELEQRGAPLARLEVS